MDSVFLHAGHQVREAFNGLEVVSWLVVGLAVGAVVLAWGRLVAWLRSADAEAPRLVRQGRDDGGWFFEVSAAEGVAWSVESPDGSRAPLSLDAEGLLRPPTAFGEPSALVSGEGVRLTL